MNTQPSHPVYGAHPPKNPNGSYSAAVPHSANRQQTYGQHPPHPQNGSNLPPTLTPPQQAPSSQTTESSGNRRYITQFILNILYGSLILSAFIGIFAIVFGNDNYGSKAFGTILLLVVVDVILLLALLPKNVWFRYAIWIFSILAFSFTTLGIWLPKNVVRYSDTYPYEMVAQSRTFGEIAQGIGVGFWLLLATIVLLSFVSLAEPLIKKTGTRGLFFYYSLIVVAITGTLPIAISSPLTINTNLNPEFPLKIYASAFILSLTIMLILAIAIAAKTIIDLTGKNPDAQTSPHPIPQNYSNNVEQPLQSWNVPSHPQQRWEQNPPVQQQQRPQPRQE